MKNQKKKYTFNEKNIENYYFSSLNSIIKGKVSIPGDKSISQRALIIALISTGITSIENILESQDVLHTKKAIELLGAVTKKNKNKTLEIYGVGLGNLKSPSQPIYMGNSGTGTRLLIGLVAGSNATVTFYGDLSLSKRPMDRVIKPLINMGATFVSKEGYKLPVTVTGALIDGFTLPINYKMPIASAQVKSAIILAALTARGTSSVLETKETRDSTESMLKEFGAEIKVEKNKKGESKIFVSGSSFIKANNIKVPGDPSSAAFIVVAALITKKSSILIKDVFYNKFRLKVFDVLKKMGANIKIIKNKDKQYCDIFAKYSKLKNIKINTKLNSSLIDEFPILSVAAASAKGEMVMKNLDELRYKESDRLKAISEGLEKCGVKIQNVKNDLNIFGNKIVVGGCVIKANNDHRIAMAFNILSLITKKPIIVIGNKSIQTSFPNFFEVLSGLGARVKRKYD